MIITFDLKEVISSGGDIIIFDNCRKLRITEITKQNRKKCYEQIYNTLAEAYLWNKKDNISKNKAFLLEFDSNYTTYYIITEGAVFISDDKDNTFKILN